MRDTGHSWLRFTKSLGEAVPQFVQVPIIQAQPVAATRPFSGISTPTIDGEDEDAWDSAAYYQILGESPITGFYYTLDKENLYFTDGPRWIFKR